ncbi:AzlC family ABC transporter permease [Treponema sp. OttesenSCG-928-L16]|nr:AzlC family ABC transporter permease [Treponema sp. OttesenSCG-928-L16]
MKTAIPHGRLLADALRFSFPVFLGYIAIGIAFGLMLVDAGYPWWLSIVMSLVMYAGAGQYAAVGLFASGAPLWEAVLVQLVLNARHMAYGLTMLKRFNAAGPFKLYLIFSLTDETFALLSSVSGEDGQDTEKRSRFMFYVALLDHFYWVAGSVIGAIAGTLIPFNIEGIGFALTALFIVLMIEQVYRLKKAMPFVVSALITVAVTLIFPARISILSALVISLVMVQILGGHGFAEDRSRPC